MKESPASFIGVSESKFSDCTFSYCGLTCPLKYKGRGRFQSTGAPHDRVSDLLEQLTAIGSEWDFGDTPDKCREGG